MRGLLGKLFYLAFPGVSQILTRKQQLTIKKDWQEFVFVDYFFAAVRLSNLLFSRQNDTNY